MMNKLIEAGIRAGDSRMFEQDKVWSKYSHDKVDIGEELTKVIRTLDKALPLSLPLRALSIGSSDEPQFRILETVFRGGLYLLDIDNAALDIVRERIKRQQTNNVICIKADYNKVFNDARNVEKFLRNVMARKKVNLITLHHSLYYCKACDWNGIFRYLYKSVLSNTGAMHAVLMASKSNDEYTTTWLYNHFAGKFFGCYNDQDLRKLKSEFQGDCLFENAQMSLRRHNVHFWTDDFERFMAVVWMILLYPNVHKYNLTQKEEICEFVYKKFWIRKKPLIQAQDHLVIYKGIPFSGLA
jgi:hypothetical protein